MRKSAPKSFFIYLLVVLPVVLPLISFTNNSDSLINNLQLTINNYSKDDTTKVNLLNQLSEQLWRNGVYDTALFHAENAKNIAEKLGFKKGIANSYNNIGIIFWYQGDYPEALKNYFVSIKIKEETGDKKGIAYSYNNIGLIYEYQGNYPEALKNHFAALKIKEELGDKQGIANSYNNIGAIYDYQGNYPEALKNHFASLKIKEEIGDKAGIAASYNNIGNIYQYQGNYPEVHQVERDSLFSLALKNYFASLKIKEEIGDKKGIAASYNNIGAIYDNQGNYPEIHPVERDSLLNRALKNYFASLKIREEIGDKAGIAISFLNIGLVELSQNNIANSKKYLDDGLALAKEIGYKEYIKDAYSNLSQFDSTTGNFKGAYSNYKFYSVYKDSLFSEEKSKEIGRLEMSHEYEMAEMERKKVEEEARRQEAAAIGRRYMLQYSGILLGLVFLFMSIFLLARKFRKIKDSKVYEKYLKIVEATLFISFLIFFEFILVFLDPYLDKITGGEPAYKLLVNAILAGVIFPLHSFLEAKLKGQIVKTERKKWAKKIKSANSKSFFIYLLLVILSLLNISFTNNSDSLINNLQLIINNSKDDTTKVNLLNQLSEQLWRTGVYDTALFHAGNAKNLAEKLDFKKGIANSYNNIGIIYKNQSNYPEALKNHFAALKIREELVDKQGIANSYNNIGLIYDYQGNYPEALKNYFASLIIREEIGDKKRIAGSYNNIGENYRMQGNYPEALKNYFAALKIKEEIGDKQGTAGSYSNIGIIYFYQGNYSEVHPVERDSLLNRALKNYFAALKINEEFGNKQGIATSYNNIGIIYKKQGNYPEALKNYFATLKIMEEIGDKAGIAGSFLNIGSAELMLNNSINSKKYLDDALILSKEIGYKELIKDAFRNLSQLDSTTGNFKGAYHNYKFFTLYKDSLFSEEKSKEIGRLEMRHEFEMAELERKKIEEEAARQEAAAVSRRNMLQYSGIMLTLVFLFMSIFLLVRKFKKIKEHKVYEQYVKIVEATLFISFLIFFEFILVLLDPYIDQYTGGEPAYKLLINAILAGLIFPLHSFLEAKIIARIIIPHPSPSPKWRGETSPQPLSKMERG